MLLKGTLVSLHLLREQLCRYQEDDLLPTHWTFDSLGLWCRVVARHNEGLLSDTEDGVLKDILRRYIERVLSAQDLVRLMTLKAGSDDFLHRLAVEIDELVRSELIFRVTGCVRQVTSLDKLFNNHFPLELSTAN